MSKLDDFAAAALASIDFTDADERHIAKRVYDIAESMLKESEKRQGDKAWEAPVVAAMAPALHGPISSASNGTATVQYPVVPNRPDQRLSPHNIGS